MAISPDNDRLVAVVWFVVLPIPSWPQELHPHAHTVPLVSSARECWPPADTWMTPAKFVHAIGRRLSIVVPLPSWPNVFAPQACTKPPLSKASVCPPPTLVSTI